jgi:Armadillo/beta-catenin-like repeat
LGSLTTLSFSDNVDLQRSAALAFAEITEKEVRPVGRDTLDPILFLLSSHDTEVQRAASAALGNLAVNSKLNFAPPPQTLIIIIASRQQAAYRKTWWIGTFDSPNA